MSTDLEPQSEIRRLLQRQGEIRQAMRQPGGIRITVERELFAIREQLKKYTLPSAALPSDVDATSRAQ